MRNVKEVKFEFFLFKLKHFAIIMGSILAIIPIPKLMVSFRLYPVNINKEESLYLYWLFDELQKSLINDAVEVYYDEFETMVVIDNRYVLILWYRNRSYADMKLSVFEKFHYENFVFNRRHLSEKHPPYYLACKMRDFNDMVLNNGSPPTPKTSATATLMKPLDINVGSIKDMIIAKMMEGL